MFPLGKLKTERLVPVDSFVCQLVQRLRFFRSLDYLTLPSRELEREVCLFHPASVSPQSGF